MAKTAALMLAALFVMSALFSSSEAATGIDYSALVGNNPKLDFLTNHAKRACQALHSCRSNRKLLSSSEKSISVVVQATEKKADYLKFKFLSLFH
ncbi:hypothetical protein AAHA92_04945 [Salvia divinorum]|uniref:Pectinesterase inhibitor domain-containing protein n=1 Tax=Salvia divinorum TaxID=28513 RepID=A0ABD1I0V9_SALDI